MRKAEIIEKTLREMSHGTELSSETQAWTRATLNERLPEGDSKTCADFADLSVTCCESCHTSHPMYDMYAVDLPTGDKGWICCTVRWALFPETKLDENSPEMKKLRKEALGHE